MIPLIDKQYESIGRVAVQSGALEHELEEYIVRLAHITTERSLWLSRINTLSGKVTFLDNQLKLRSLTSSAKKDFEFAFCTIRKLIKKRNTTIHGVWSFASNTPFILGDVIATGRKGGIHADDAAAVASQLRLARKLLLRLFHDHCPDANIEKCPRKTATALRKDLSRAYESHKWR